MVSKVILVAEDDPNDVRDGVKVSVIVPPFTGRTQHPPQHCYGEWVVSFEKGDS
jgi:hypothetical protein